MRKKVEGFKRLGCLGLVFLLSINSVAAIVSDNDGAAFITKAEFDALKNDFQSQIDSYNSSIDSKIDGAIANYLAGIKLSNTFEAELITNDWVYFGHPPIWQTKQRCLQAFLTNFVETETWASGGSLVENSRYVWHLTGCTKYPNCIGATNQIQNISDPTNTTWENGTSICGQKGHLLLYVKGTLNSNDYLKEWHEGQVNRLAVTACTMDSNDHCSLPKTTTVADASGTHQEFDTRIWQWNECNWDGIAAQYYLGQKTKHDFHNLIWNGAVDSSTRNQYSRDEDRYYILDEQSSHYEHGSGISGCIVQGKMSKTNWLKIDLFNWKSETKNWDDLGSYIHRNFKKFVGVCDGLVVCNAEDSAAYTITCQCDTDNATIYIKNAAFAKCAPDAETLSPLSITCQNNCSLVSGKVNAIKINSKNTPTKFIVENPTKNYLYIKSGDDIGIKLEQVQGKKDN